MKKIACEPMVGSDIEFFALQDSAILPCVGIIPGTKEKPWSGKNWTPGFALQEDNVMVEVNIPPCTSAHDFTEAVNAVKRYATRELSKRIDPVDLPFIDLARKVTHTFTEEQLDSPQAQLIGCDPDFDAYTGGEIRHAPEDVLGLSRSCGGHIHIGGDFKCPDFVAALFTELIYCSMTGPRGIDKGVRAKWYGQPGIFRPKPYGIEYRTPSNKWAFDENDTWAAGVAGMRAAKYLTNTDAAQLHDTFNAINWTEVRDYVANPDSKKWKALRGIANSHGMGEL